MKLQARPYRDPADLIPMRQLVMTGRQTKIPASYMHPGCLDWDTHYPPDEEANRRNLRLWERWMKTRLGWKRGRSFRVGKAVLISLSALPCMARRCTSA